MPTTTVMKISTAKTKPIANSGLLESPELFKSGTSYMLKNRKEIKEHVGQVNLTKRRSQIHLI